MGQRQERQKERFFKYTTPWLGRGIPVNAILKEKYLKIQEGWFKALRPL